MMDKIPEPNDDGSSGQQVSGHDLNVIIVPQKSIGSPIERTISVLASTNSRNMGGEVVANLLAGSVTHITDELSQTKLDLASERAEVKTLKNDLENTRIELAELKSKISYSENEKLFRNFCLVAGPTLIGIGIDSIRGGQVNTGWLLVFFGVSFLIVGWFSIGGRKSK